LPTVASWRHRLPGKRGRSRHKVAALLIDYEEDRTLRAVLVGMLREGDRER
jgi:hypothetical protein